MIVARKTGFGVFQKGANLGKPFLRVKFNGENITIGVTENIAKAAESKDFVILKVFGLTDQYPTTNDSTTLDAEGKPLYKAGDKLTVAEYWEKRRALNPEVQSRVLVNFDGFPTEAEEKLIAEARVSKMVISA